MFELYPAGDTPHLDGTVTDIATEEMEPLTIDDFSDGDLSEYAVPSGVSIVSDPAYTGGYAAQLGVNANEMNSPLASMEGLPIYPRIGDTFTVRWRLGNPADHADTGSALGGVFGINFALTGPTNTRYRVASNFGNGAMVLQDRSGTTVNLGSEDNIPWTADTWYETTIQWRNTGVITVEVRDASTGDLVAGINRADTVNSDIVGGGFGVGMFSLEQAVTVDTITIDNRDGWPAHTVDGFEDGDLTDYSRVDAMWSISSSAALTGLNGVRGSGPDGGFLVSMPGQGLDSYPSVGEITRADFRFESAGGYLALYLGVQDSSGSTRYEVRFHQGSGRLLITRRTGGTTVLNSTDVTFSPGTTYRAEVEWGTDGVFHVVIRNRDTGEHHVRLDTSNSPDQTYTDGGYGLFAYADTTVSVDTVELVNKDSLSQPTATRENLDSFEDSGMSEYTTYDTGGTFSATSSPNAVDGSNICLVSDGVNGAGAITTANSLSGLPRYPERGDTFGCFVGSKFNNTKASIAWACQEDINPYPQGYHVWIDGRDDTLSLLRYDDTHTRVDLASARFDATAWNNGEMCRLEVEFGSPTIAVSLYDSNNNRIQRISADDSTTALDYGGLGFGIEKGTDSSTTAELYFDQFYRVGDSSTTTPTTVVENFEANTLADFDQSESPWQITASSPIEGSYSVYHPSGSSAAYLRDRTNHPTTPQPGDTVEWEWLELDGADNIVWYMGQDLFSTSSGHYELEIDLGANVVSFIHDNGTSEIELHSETWSHTLVDLHRTTISDDGAANPTFDITIENLTQGTTPVSFSVQDTNGDPRSGDGFGWFAGFGAALKLDNLTVTR